MISDSERLAASAETVVTWEVDHGPGPPYRPWMHTNALKRATERLYGKQYFLTILGTGCSQSWVSDDKAEKIIAKHS